ncbi:MAG: HDOD domain-containing protein [Clostridiales bacterium]|nr:HDOD domain-containing protein [Clostridiales bacterium]
MNILSLENIVKRVKEIPALPDVVLKVMQLTEDPDSTPHDIESVVLKDQGITTRVLRLANSAYYGYPRRISTISEATILLGFQTIRSITLSAAVNKVLMREIPGYGMKKGSLWRHSQAVAIIARHISRQNRMKDTEEVYVAGLLHDIGKVIMGHYIEKAYSEVLDMVIDSNMTFLDAEEKVLGFNHAQVGAKVAEKWNLPESLVEAIAYHHIPQEANIAPKMTCIVHISDAIAMMMGIGLGVDGMAYSISDYAMKTLRFDSNSQIDKIMSSVSDMLTDEAIFS